MQRWGWTVGGLVASVPLVAALGQPDIPLMVRLVLALQWGATLWRPQWGLMSWAFLTPIAAAILASAGPTPMTGDGFTDALAVATLAAAALRAGRAAAPPTRLGRPALVLGAIIAAAAIVDLSLVHLLSPSSRAFAGDLWSHVTGTYFTDQRSLASWHLSAHWLEALALAVVLERTARESPSTARAVTLSALCGLTVAAGFSGLRLTEIVLNAAHRMDALVHHLTVTRISPFLPDVNATGSLLALTAAAWLVAVGAPQRSSRARVVAAIAAALALLALWLTGSRAAQAALVLGVATGLAWLYHARGRVLALAGVGLLMVAGVGSTLMPARTTQSDAATSLGVRWDMARISLQVAQTAPAFGVGAGQFREASIPFVSDALIARFPQTRVGENAHNQVLQILGEWGVVGLSAWVWCLIAAAGALRSTERPWWRGALLGGWTAFLLSALLGHPWLMGPVIFLTVPALGLIAAGGPAPTRAGAWWTRAGVLALLVVATIPLRASERRFLTDLDHYVVGASRTAGEQDGLPFRTARASSTWFVRASAQVIEIPLRVDPESPSPSCTVTLRVDGKPANQMPVTPSAWTRVRFALTAGVYRQVNRRIDIIAAPDSCALRVGRFTILD